MGRYTYALSYKDKNGVQKRVLVDGELFTLSTWLQYIGEGKVVSIYSSSSKAVYSLYNEFISKTMYFMSLWNRYNIRIGFLKLGNVCEYIKSNRVVESFDYEDKFLFKVPYFGFNNDKTLYTGGITI